MDAMAVAWDDPRDGRGKGELVQHMNHEEKAVAKGGRGESYGRGRDGQSLLSKRAETTAAAAAAAAARFAAVRQSRSSSPVQQLCTSRQRFALSIFSVLFSPLSRANPATSSAGKTDN